MQKTMFDRSSRNIAILLAAFTVAFWVVSCKSDDPIPGKASPSLPDIPPIVKNVADAAATVGGAAESIGESADTIDKHTNQIEIKTAPENRPVIQPEIDGIRTETDDLRNVKTELVSTRQKLIDTQANLESEQKKVKEWVEYSQSANSRNAKLVEENRKLKDQSAQMFKRNMAYLGVVCTIGIGISLVIGFWAKSKTAIFVAIGFGVTLAVATAVSIFLETIALVTICIMGVAFIGAIGYLAWQFIQNNKVEKELVQTGEITKQYLPPSVREHLFGYGAEPGKLDQVQSKVTKDRVKKIRQYGPKSNAVKLAPSMPEYWRPTTPSGGIDPYISSISSNSRDTII